jgi:AbrB family looped-hinge helix DNA binding protein
MVTTLTVKVDAQGRLTIPPQVLRRLGIHAGDTFVLECDEAHKALRFTKAENPFDLLVERALAEHHLGLPRALPYLPAEDGVAIDAS